MKRSLPAAALTAALLSSAAVSATPASDRAELDHQIRVVETALTQSSVAGYLNEPQAQQVRNMIERARSSAAAGAVRTASAQLLEAGRLLYPMEGGAEMTLRGERQQIWMDQLDQVIAVLLPSAHEIAREKGAETAGLSRASDLLDLARQAREAGIVEQATELYQESYAAIQSVLVALRSGDQLRVETPDQASEAGWSDAERRYRDWLFFADWMVNMAPAMGTDPERIRAGSRAAEEIYQQARPLAESGRWADATRLMDKAYRAMEDHWRSAGVDI